MTEEKKTTPHKPEKTPLIGRLLKKLILLAMLCAVIAGAAGAWWFQKWVDTPVTIVQPSVEVEIARGTSARNVVQAIVNAGVQVEPEVLYQYFRWSGQSRDIRAGYYEFTVADTPRTIAQKLVSGAEIVRTIVFPEGYTFAQMRQRLAESPDLKQDSASMTDAQIMETLGRPGQHPEGLFFPDTYTFSKGSSDLQVLKRAMQQMDAVLEQIWLERDADLPLKNSYEMLILASIIEKETGRPEDRFMVGGVFINRLNEGWKLQTDPTVVYGLGSAYTGRITRRNLDTDTPYNTYTRVGLTPTPIAMPGRDSLLAAAHPANTKAMFFVSRGDGSSHFSQNNRDHDRAVNHYIRGSRTPPPASLTGIEQ